jgi:hypothetical protein
MLMKNAHLMQSAIVGLQLDARPGGHAKWVKSPHGPATVSGEQTLRQFRIVVAAFFAAWSKDPAYDGIRRH